MSNIENETPGVSTQAVIAIYTDRPAAQKAMPALTASGIAASSISLVAQTAEADSAMPASEAAENREGAARGVLVGAALGVLLSLEAVLFGQGGPITEIETVEEATVFGLAPSALSGPDPTNAASKLYRDELRRGRVLVIVHPADTAVAEKATAALAPTDPLDVRTLSVVPAL